MNNFEGFDIGVGVIVGAVILAAYICGAIIVAAAMIITVLG